MVEYSIKNKISSILNTFADYKLGLACSGGVDSMLLAFILKQAGYEFIALIVDHGVRSESRQEAHGVQNILKTHGIESKILTLDTLKNSNEGILREKRYEAIYNECKILGISHLFLAHHIDDQLETFFLRLERGSGPDGLCCMQEISHYRDIYLVRPFLNTLNKTQIRELADRYSLGFFEDYTNKDVRFKRNHIRHLLNEIGNKDLVSKRTLLLINQLQDLRQMKNKYCEINFRQCVRFDKLGFVLISLDKFRHLLKYEKLELLVSTLITVSNQQYKPNYIQTEKILEMIQNTKTFTTTLLHCKLIKKGDFVYVIKEANHTQALKITGRGRIHWDFRFELVYDLKEELELKSIAPKDYPIAKKILANDNYPQLINKEAILAYPAFYKNETLVNIVETELAFKAWQGTDLN